MKMFIIGKREIALFTVCTLMLVFTVLCVPKASEIAASVNDVRKLPIYSVKTDKKEIAITFDAAWGNSDTEKLLNLLNKYEAKATFFFTGGFVSRYPDDILKINSEGHEIANHTDSHRHIKNMTSNEIYDDILTCSKKLKALTGNSPNLVRGPYGEYNNNFINSAEKLKLKTIQWDTDSRDWQKKGKDKIVNNVLKSAKNGSIILFHNDIADTYLALTEILPKLKNQGYKFVSVSNLIYKDNFYIDSNGRQIKL